MFLYSALEFARKFSKACLNFYSGNQLLFIRHNTVVQLDCIYFTVLHKYYKNVTCCFTRILTSPQLFPKTSIWCITYPTFMKFNLLFRLYHHWRYNTIVNYNKLCYCVTLSHHSSLSTTTNHHYRAYTISVLLFVWNCFTKVYLTRAELLWLYTM